MDNLRGTTFDVAGDPIGQKGQYAGEPLTPPVPSKPSILVVRAAADAEILHRLLDLLKTLAAVDPHGADDGFHARRERGLWNVVLLTRIWNDQIDHAVFAALSS